MSIELKAVGFHYPDNPWLLKDISLVIEANERVALVGPSGCGKTTLCKMIAGYLKPTTGEILWQGKPLLEAGYCPIQLIHQHPEKTFNPKWRMYRSLNEANGLDEEVLDGLKIRPEWLKKWPSELSGGELQRISIARALGVKTQFIIADEITTMLDMITQAQIWQYLLSVLEKRQIGLIAITHRQELAKHIATRSIQIDQLIT